MRAVTPFLATRMADFAIDRDLAMFDRDEAEQERRQEYVNKRADEIYQKRIASMSTSDFILALERISTLPREIGRLHYLTMSDELPFATELKAMVQAALLCDSIEIATTESRVI
ncbi:hypothetical protein BURKHO8Y_110248 [Burkholderia sp. 8Y]|uniref:hypothetical protein n=1 Tax=Burkholderia sp. 8Y TaxID=2653133 RepID=UPI0012EFD8AC|nr:hypothetical protein [Burkholderia sp. 8Y]VXB23851.1 hypothetical protein BURKHO8Y_110248 [Burkholderia sp. 8Y]